ncbi:MAG: hypothetical protein HYX48_04120 [Chlamydiales bacterium]|nr:hypothetical protein [Chlamydiales bacterium]
MVMPINLDNIRNPNTEGYAYAPLTYRLLDLVTGFTCVDREIECLENMARRVIGALCYAGLLVALIVEEAIRIPLFLAAALVTAPFSFFSSEACEKTWSGASLVQVFVGCAYLVDGVVRVPSALIQKCLLDARDEFGIPKDLSELTICTC